MCAELAPRRFPDLLNQDDRLDKIMTEIVGNKETIMCAGCRRVFQVCQIRAESRAAICARCGWLMCNFCLGSHAKNCDLGLYNQDIVGRRKPVFSDKLILGQNRKEMGI